MLGTYSSYVAFIHKFPSFLCTYQAFHTRNCK
jgi:hypothetical protein